MIDIIIDWLVSAWNYLLLTFGSSGVVQLISSVFILSSALIAFESTKRKTAIDIITKNRIEWTNTIRDRASKITYLVLKIANNRNLYAVSSKKGSKVLDKDGLIKHFEDLHELNKMISELRLYFNPYESKIEEIFSILDSISDEFNKDYKEINFESVSKKTDKFNIILSIELKSEWERIKKEAGVKISLNERIKKLFKFIRRQ